MYTESLSYNVQGKRTWIAKLTGICEKYGFEREFLDATSINSSASGKTGYKHYDLDDGVYESCERGRREFFEVDGDEAYALDEDEVRRMVG